MTALELWTQVRFTLYPILFVFGLLWAFLLARQYRVCYSKLHLWSMWQGVSLSVLGASGFVALLVAQRYGFSPYTSMILTFGLFVVAVVLVSGTVSMWVWAWRKHDT